MTNTRDMSKFGQRERFIAGQLLTALNTYDDRTEYLGDGVAIEFNLMSGKVFLIDEDYNVGVMEGDKLVDFRSCPECGEEGTIEDLKALDNDCCSEYLEEI